MKKFLSRKVVLKDSQGLETSYPISIATLYDDGSIGIYPFIKEEHSVEYVDGELRLSQDGAGKWHIC